LRDGANVQLSAEFEADPKEYTLNMDDQEPKEHQHVANTEQLNALADHAALMSDSTIFEDNLIQLGSTTGLQEKLNSYI